MGKLSKGLPGTDGDSIGMGITLASMIHSQAHPSLPCFDLCSYDHLGALDFINRVLTKLDKR